MRMLFLLVLIFVGCQHQNANRSKVALTQITQELSDDIKPRISPDGAFVAYQAIRNGQSDILVRSLSTGAMMDFATSSDNESTPSWSPDSRELLFSRTHQGTDGLFRKKLDAGEETLVFWSDTLQLNRADWSPDGRRVVATGRYHNKYYQWVLELSTGILRRVTENGDEYNARWLANNREIIYYTGRNDSIMVLDVDSQTYQCLSKGEYTGYYPHVAPDNSRFIFTSHLGGSQNIWMGRRNSDEIQQLTQEAYNYFPSWFPDGRSIVLSRRLEDEQLYSLNPKTGETTKLTEGHIHKWPRVSPSGVVALVEVDASFRQYIALLEGSTVRRVSESFTFIEYLEWSDDDSYIAFTGTQSSDIQPDQSLSIYVLDLQTGQSREVVTAGRIRNLVWLNGMSQVVYSARGPDQKLVLKTVDVETGENKRLLEMDHSVMASDYDPVARKLLVFCRVNYSDFRMFTYDMATGEVEQLLNEQSTPSEGRFSPDGASMLFLSRDGGQFDLKVLDTNMSSTHDATSDVYRESPADWVSDSLIIYSANKNSLNLWQLEVDGL